jgi:proteic killer suppression protein
VFVEGHDPVVEHPFVRIVDDFRQGKFSATLPQAIQKAAARKLEIIDAVRDLNDLRTPPGNRLEALSGDRRG